MEETWVDKLAKSETISNVRRMAIAVLLGVSSIVGHGAVVATGLVGPGLSALQNHFDEKRKLKKLLHFYKEEISALTGKPEDALTLADLKQAGAPVEKGGLGLKAISDQLEEYSFSKKYHIGISIVSSILTVGAILGASALMPELLAHMPNLWQMGVVSLGYWAIRNSVGAVASSVTGHDGTEQGLSDKLMELEEKGRSKPLQAVEVFNLFAENNTGLAAAIESRFGRPFDKLMVMQKKKAMEMFEPQIRAQALTEEINRGAIDISVIGVIVHDQGEKGMADYERYKALFNQPVAPASQESPDLSDGSEEKAKSRFWEERVDIPSLTPGGRFH